MLFHKTIENSVLKLSLKGTFVLSNQLHMRKDQWGEFGRKMTAHVWLYLAFVRNVIFATLISYIPGNHYS